MDDMDVSVESAKEIEGQPGSDHGWQEGVSYFAAGVT